MTRTPPNVRPSRIDARERQRHTDLGRDAPTQHDSIPAPGVFETGKSVQRRRRRPTHLRNASIASTPPDPGDHTTCDRDQFTALMQRRMQRHRLNHREHVVAPPANNTVASQDLDILASKDGIDELAMRRNEICGSEPEFRQIIDRDAVKDP